MSKLVIKFGGTSVMDTNRIRNAAQIVMSEVAKGHQVVVVVSAMGHTTDHLIGLAESLHSFPDRRELDNLIVTGEQISSSLLALALQAHGAKARSFSGAGAGILTDSEFGCANIQKIDPQSLIDCLQTECIPVVAGFQGKDSADQWTTLGRGGSDTTAIALAAAIGAERCDIYTDVEGIYSADPRLFANAYKLEAISYKEMLEMARHGAQVLNARSVEIAMQNNVMVRVRSTFQPDEIGTLVTDEAKQVNWFTGIAVSRDRACIKLKLWSPEHSDKRAKRVFRHDRYNIKQSLQSWLVKAGIEFEFGRSLRDCACEVSVCVAENDIEKIIKILEAAACDLDFKSISVERQLVKVSIVAHELSSANEVDAILALTKVGVPISILISGKHRLSVVIPSSMRELAIQNLHVNMCELQMAS